MKSTSISTIAKSDCVQRRRSPSDHQLSALASLHRSKKTRANAQIVLREAGFTGVGANVDALIARMYEIERAHCERHTRRIQKRLGHLPPQTKRSSDRAAVCLPEGRPIDRLQRLRYQAVKTTATNCLRSGAAGGSSFRVSLTCDPTAVGYEVVMGSNRTTYRGKYKGWSAAEDHHRICIPADWRVRVQRRGLAEAGGMMTLDLRQMSSQGEVELFEAVWVAQARGYDVTVHSGVIARLGTEVFHGRDASHAIRGITSKTRNLASPRRQPVSGYELSVEAFAERYSRFANVVVSVDDAREIGACESGIQSWCQAVGIDLAQQRVPLSHILEGFRMRPLQEVRRTVLQAIKRYRSAARCT